MDIETTMTDAPLIVTKDLKKTYLMGLHRICKDVVFLGSYPRADRKPPKVPYGGEDADYSRARDWLEVLHRPHV